MLGIVARMDLGSGLQAQTLALCKMLRPDKVLLIDSTPFNKAEQHPELYDGFNVDKVMGFLTKDQYYQWMNGLTHILSAECFYNDYLVNHTMSLGIKTYLQPNAEFYSHAVTPPTKFLMPSHWHLNEFKERYGDRVEYLPPPLFPNEFKKAREANFKRSGKRFLHIVGKLASKDRNGTLSLLEALKHTDKDFELVIKSQYELPPEYQTDDKRVTYDIRNVEEQQDLYTDFDAMILPRRYGGLCLPVNEALVSGLPVIMTDISPQNQVLPKEWLVQSNILDSLQTRILLDVHTADAKKLAEKIDWLCSLNSLNLWKTKAFEIGMTYAADSLRDKYKEVMA